jgi:hypothetical protein
LSGFYDYFLQVSWLRADTLQIFSAGRFFFIPDRRYNMQEEENIWTLRVEEVEEEDGGEYECQVTHSDGMDAHVYKLDVVNEDSSEIDLFDKSVKTLSDDPLSAKP